MRRIILTYLLFHICYISKIRYLFKLFHNVIISVFRHYHLPSFYLPLLGLVYTSPGWFSARVGRPLMGLDYFFCLHEAGLVKTPVFIFNPGQFAPTRVGIQLKLLQFCTHILLFTAGAAWPTGTPGYFPVGRQKFVACGPPRQAIFSPISLVKINKLFVISAPASHIYVIICNICTC